MFINIVFWLGSDRLLGLLRASFTAFHTHASLLTLFICLIVLFHSCGSYARVFGKTLLQELPISNSYIEWRFLFSLCGSRVTKHAQRTL